MCREGMIQQWYKKQTLIYLHTALCTHAKVGQPSVSDYVPLLTAR